MPPYASIPDVIDSYRERFLPDEAAGVDGVVQLNFTGDGGGAYHLVIREQKLELVEGLHEAPTVAVTVAASDWLRVNNGETNAMALMMQGRLKVNGSLPMATRFQSLFRRAT